MTLATMEDEFAVTFDEDPARFLERAGDRLAAEPVVATVIGFEPVVDLVELTLH